MSLISLFQQTVEKEGSDLHLAGGERPMIRINGDLQDAGASPLSDAEMSDFLKTILTKEQLGRFSSDLELDAAIEHEGERFRVNVHQEAGHIALAARHIPRRIPSPELLRFEPSL